MGRNPVPEQDRKKHQVMARFTDGQAERMDAVCADLGWDRSFLIVTATMDFVELQERVIAARKKKK